MHRALAEATDPDARSRSPRLAPGAAPPRARRGRRRGARALGRPGAGARRPGRGGRLPRARRRADARARRARARARAGRGAGQAPGRRARRGAGTAGDGGGRAARRARSAPGWSCCAPRSRSPSSRGSDAPPLLLTAAKRLEPLDVALARETYLDALSAAMFAGRLAGGGGLLEVARAARAAPAAVAAPRAADLLLDGLALLFTEGYAAGAPMLQAGAERLPQRATAHARRSSAGCGSPATPRIDLVGRRGLGRARHPPRPARPRGRRARRAPARAQLRASACTCSPASSPRPRR